MSGDANLPEPCHPRTLVNLLPCRWQNHTHTSPFSASGVGTAATTAPALPSAAAAAGLPGARDPKADATDAAPSDPRRPVTLLLLLLLRVDPSGGPSAAMTLPLSPSYHGASMVCCIFLAQS